MGWSEIGVETVCEWGGDGGSESIPLGSSWLPGAVTKTLMGMGDTGRALPASRRHRDRGSEVGGSSARSRCGSGPGTQRLPGRGCPKPHPRLVRALPERFGPERGESRARISCRAVTPSGAGGGRARLPPLPVGRGGKLRCFSDARAHRTAPVLLNVAPRRCVRSAVCSRSSSTESRWLPGLLSAQ